jgi:phospholipase/carboxylesterase
MSSGLRTDLSLRYLVSVPSGRADAVGMPMVVLIHGRGADANDLADLAPMLDTPDGCRFILPNAPKPFEAYPGMNYGWTWFDGWPPEQQSVAASRAILLSFLTEITAKYPTTSLILSGFSQGAMMSLDAGLRAEGLRAEGLRAERSVAAIVAMSGGLYEQDLPDLRPRAGLPVLITHGSADDVVPVNYARRARRILEDAGLDVEYHEYAMGHQIVPEEAALVKQFLARVTRG